MARGRSRDKSRKMIQMIKDDGWFYVRSNGDHRLFKHPTKPGVVTVPFSITKNIELHILRQAGLRKNPFKEAGK